MTQRPVRVTIAPLTVAILLGLGAVGGVLFLPHRYAMALGVGWAVTMVTLYVLARR